MSQLGRRVPTDDNHIRKYGLTMETMPTVATPVVIGINWYDSFFEPTKDSHGRWWIGRGPIGRLAGGHCVALKPSSIPDNLSWWDWYNQGQEGACVGFGSTRALSLIYRKRFDPHWLYHEAQLADEWDDTPPEEGTSVRAAFDILRSKGAVLNIRGVAGPLNNTYGVVENRWAKTVDEIIACLAAPRLYDIGGIPFLNSWGRDYPHITYIPLDVMQRLLNEDGEATLFVPKPVAQKSAIKRFGEALWKTVKCDHEQ